MKRLLLFFFLMVSLGAYAADKRPNILFAIADDWGYPHAGIYNDKVVKTPVFDRVARNGILFQHAYISSPSCAPSRAAILTGQWHWRLKEAANLYGPIPLETPIYTDLLRESGYYVGMTRKGWGPGNYTGRPFNPAGKEYEDFQAFFKQRPADKPFCFWFGSKDPHRSYYPEGCGADAGIKVSKVEPPACFPNSKEIRSDIADYYFEVQRFDREVGDILSIIEDAGELENTLVIITGDHGMPFPRAKSNLYDLGARVPLAIQWPKAIKKHKNVTDFVSLTDLAPTFLEVAGLKVPQVITGKSLVKCLKSQSNKPDPQRQSVLCGKERHVPSQEAPNSGGYPCRSLRNHKFLLIRNFITERWPAGTPNYQKAWFEGSWYGDCDNGPTKTYMIKNKDKDELHKKLFELSFGFRPEFELYDLEKDPHQLNNVAGKTAYAGILKKMTGELMTRLKDSGDPRATGGGQEFDSYPYTGGSPLAPEFEAAKRAKWKNKKKKK